KSMGYSVCGGTVEGLEEPPKKFWGIRLLGMLRMLKYLKDADTVIADFTEQAKHFSLPVSGSSIELAQALQKEEPFYSKAMEVHLQSSTTSGVATNILQSMISGGQESTATEQAEAADLM